MKKCPYCAEEIQDEAIVCRYCGRDLAPESPESSQGAAASSPPQAAPPPPPPPPPPSAQPDTSSKRRKTGCWSIGCLALLLIFLLLVLARACGDGTSPSRSKTSPKETVLFAQQQDVPVHSEPSDDSDILERLDLATRVIAVGTKGPWTQLRGAEARWVKSDLLGPQKPLTPEEREQRTNDILAELQTLPASEAQKNRDLYKKLVQLHPEEQQYQDKVDFYSKKLEEQRKREKAEQEAATERRRLANKWSYQKSVDPMTSAATRSATIASENTVSFDFPYQGAQHGTLIIRDHPSYGKDVILKIERGQFLCPSYQACDIRIRFDEGSPSTWKAVGPSDNSTTTIFLRNQASFRQRMRSSKVVKIQAPIYNEGNPVFEFHVGGFDQARFSE